MVVERRLDGWLPAEAEDEEELDVEGVGSVLVSGEE